MNNFICCDVYILPSINFISIGYLVQVAQALGATDVEMIFSEFGLAGIAPGMEGLVDKKAASVEAAKAKAVERGSQ